MPPYSARGEGNRGKVHRAVLIGVERYTGARNDLPAVRRNLELMADALTSEATGVLDRRDIVFVPEPSVPESSVPESSASEPSARESSAPEPSGPESVVPGPGVEPADVNPLEALTALRKARDEVEGLLIVYFAGHGIVRPDGSDLHLLFTSSRVTRGHQNPFVDALSWHDHVMAELRLAKADWVVVILDCCYAGNALNWFDPRTGQNFALLTAAERGVEIPAGDPATGTEFTAGLHQLLTRHRRSDEPAAFIKLYSELCEVLAPLRAVDAHRWIPGERRHGDDVLLAVERGSGTARGGDEEGREGRAEERARAEGEAKAEVRLPARTAFGALIGRCRPRRNRTTAVVLAGVVALGGAGIWMGGLLAGGGPGSCRPPMELRVLADPDIRPTVQQAADAYPKRDGRGCRSVGITVYDAKATDTVAAFRSSSLWQEPPAGCPPSGDCPQPQRDLGAQPDIWIPAAGSAWQQVMHKGDDRKRVVRFERLGSVASTPMVLAVPDRMPLANDAQTGSPLGSIISALDTAYGKPFSVLRPDPEVTDGALLSTESLYASPATGSAIALEQGMVQELSPTPPTARALMCALADGSRTDLEDEAVVLVPEQTMALFNLKVGHPSRPSCARETLDRRTAQYPTDIPVLDLPFLRVTWDGADRDTDARRKAVTDFYDWLAKNPDGQKHFIRDGFRGVGGNGRPALPDSASLLRTEVHETVRQELHPTVEGAATPASLSRTLSRYRQALGPGRVLYLLDNSTSMADKQVWEGTVGAKGLVTRSMGSLGAKDEFGVWSLAVDKGRTPSKVVPFERNGRDTAREAVAVSGTADYDARIADGLRGALAALRGGTAAVDQPRLLVMVTDDEDSAAIGKKELQALVTEAGQGLRVRVVVVSLHSGGCSPGRFNERITTATGGRCLDPADDIPTELSAEVARTGTGDAE